ncbi:unnamed protein product [Effrenium voratum]|uniref:Carbohydrate-binding domain-containing protein n=1 Tax=Effrenium voratum TaxID=2562239 RepID=A0AA36HN26_9DINO|nr:unnamed protein product [Effrenium voratum]
MGRWLWAAAASLSALALVQRSRPTSAALSALAAATAAAVALLLGRKPKQAGLGAFVRYPRQYVARKATVEKIDGDLEKAVWQEAEWSCAFVEIRGSDAPPGTEPSPWQETKVKMLWDDEYLYIAAKMEVDAGNELVAKFKERNSPIFHTDSDFEVFVDPAGCCHGYKELEMNALNTVWNLMLDRPYMDGGSEYSGRVAKEGEPKHWEVLRQKTAVKVTKGQIGNPTRPAQWCCEVALAHADTLGHAPRSTQPFAGSCWRINFSRVEKKGKVNWVWAPQVVWSPTDHRYVGQENMHLPDAWGYVVFADKPQDTKEFQDPAWPARHAAACVYYACRAFKEA